MSLAVSERDPRELLREVFRRVPDALGKSRGEVRSMFSGVSWEQYLALDEERGPDSAVPRLYYLDGDLEIMTLSAEHERIKKWIDHLLVEFLSHHDIDATPRGQATFRRLEQAGAEPDESWLFGPEKDVPDLVLEVALTSGGLDKLELYARLGVAEVWFWRRGALEIWTLRAGHSRYNGPATASQLLPQLEVDVLTRCISLLSWREARKSFRTALKG